MRVKVLGALRIDGGSLRPRERAVLAALVARNGGGVSADELADALWGESPPATWPKQVQTSIMRIRRELGTASVATVPSGYMLTLDPEEIDAYRFERLVETAREHSRAGDPERAVDVLGRALALWGGPPYADVPSWDVGMREAARLAEIRRSAEEDLQRAHLDAGEHDRVIPDLERLVKEEPLRERRWALLALALYRNGRQSDALAMLRAARARLDDELGVEPGRELAELQAAILRQDPALDPITKPHVVSGECPYKGLKAFGADDAETYFGREDDIRSALARLDRSPFLALAGPSGTGKSSLALAGIVPALRRRGAAVTVLTPGSATAGAIRDAPSSAAHPSVVLLDQAEELFHDADDAAAAEVCRALADRVGGGELVILTVRSDYLDALASGPALGPLVADGVHVVLPMGAGPLRRCIAEPARAAGLRLEPGLTELMLRDATGEPGALPHLSHALVETWIRREGPVLTLDGYLATGGISGAIAQSAEVLYASLTHDDRDACRSILLRLLALDEDGNPVRRRMQTRSLRADERRWTVLTRLADARLVSIVGDTVVVSHETLATAWPRLRGWLSDHAEAVRVQTLLTSAAEAWEAGGEPEDELYGGARLQTALEWRGAFPSEPTSLEARFLDASEERSTAELRETRERSRRAKVQNRRLRWSLVAAGVLLVTAAVAGTFVVINARESQQHAQDASIEALVSTALTLRDSDRDVGALLAAEAYLRWPDDPRVRSALMGTMTATAGYIGKVFISDAREGAGAMIPGTRTALMVTDWINPGIYDIDTGERVGHLGLFLEAPDRDERGAVRVSADGQVGVIQHKLRLVPRDPDSCCQTRLTFIDIARGTTLGREVTVPTPLQDDPDLGENGDVLYGVSTATGRLYAVETRTGRFVAVPVANEADEKLLAEERMGTVEVVDSSTVAVGTAGAITLVDRATLGVVRRIETPPLTAHSVVRATTDGLLIGSGDKGLVAVDAATGAVMWQQEFALQAPGQCAWMAIANEAGTFFCGDERGPVSERSLATGATTGRSIDPQLGAAGDVELLDDESRVVVFGGQTPSIAQWAVDGSGPISELVAPGKMAVDGYEPGGGSRIITVTRPDGVVPASPAAWSEWQVWDTRTRAPAYTPDADVAGITWAGSDTLLVNRADAAPRLVWLYAGRHADLPPGGGATWAGRSGRWLYRQVPEGVAIYDSETGRPTGVILDDGDVLMSLSDSPSGDMVAITEWSHVRATFETAVFDTRTGSELSRGLEWDEGSVLTPAGDVVSMTFDRLTKSTVDTLKPYNALPRPLGAGTELQVSDDGRTLLIPSLDQSVALYDLSADLLLGGSIPADAPHTTAGFLKPDGSEFIVTVAQGVMRWSLDPEEHFRAACRLAGRELSTDEWAAYLGAIGEWRPTCAGLIG